MEMKHTPGPWKLDGDSALIPIGPHQWAQAYGGTAENARAIAAVPELIEAAQDVYRLFAAGKHQATQTFHPEEFFAAMRRLNGALAKATGAK